MVRLSVVFAGALAFAAYPSTSTAEPNSAILDPGRITGTVRSAEGAPIAGAVVTLFCSCLEGPRQLITDDNGAYAFVGLPAGVYSLRVEKDKADVLRHIQLRAGGDEKAVVDIDPEGTSTPTTPKDEKKKDKTNKKKRAKGRKALSNERVTPTPAPQESSNYERNVEAILNPSAAPRTRRKMAEVQSIGGVAPQIAGAGHSSRARISHHHLRAPSAPPNTEGYAHIDDNGFRAVADAPLSTFSADVDTASYSNMRRYLNEGHLPPKDAIRVEELINYFDFDYKAPTGNKPVAVNWELGSCPWNGDHQLVHIGLKTKPIANAKIPARNLVFLLDVSGSMQAANKLPLLQQSMGLLVDQLREQDRVSIVVYAGASGLVLPPTSGSDRRAIRAAIFALRAGGSTNGAAGIDLAYQMARKAFIKDGINRVILATDGDFNVGTTSHGDLTRLIANKRNSGVFLSVLGFGMGNVKDDTMELLADRGNGNYAYIDDLSEGRRVLVEQSGATLHTVAKDVKLQVEFNPRLVAEYRLVGYENRLLRDEDFNDDTKDAGDMGAGHTVTVLYELVPVGGEAASSSRVDPLKYQDPRAARPNADSNEWMTVKVRFKRPTSSKSRLMEVPIRGTPPALARTSNNFRFAAAVAQMGMLLRGSPHQGSATFARSIELARQAQGPDPHGYRAQLIGLMRKADELR